MSAIPVIINGMLFDKLGRTTQNVVLMGSLSYADLSVGGGSVIPPPVSIPPAPVDPGYSPPWAQVPPGTPTFPIAGYPDFPYPSPPIYRPGYPGGAPPPSLPPGWGQGPPIEPPTPPTEGKPPPPDGGWGWHPDYGWGYFPGGGGKPQPPR